MRRAALESEAMDLRMLFSKQGMTQDGKVLEKTLKDIDAVITAIKLEHFEYLSHGTSTMAGQQIAAQDVHGSPSQTISQTSLQRRSLLEAEAREQEERRMAEIQIERIRTNATLDARESESRVRADMDRDRIERILLNEEDALNNSVQPLTNQGNILPTASSPHVAFSVQNISGLTAAILPSGPVPITAPESRSQNRLNHPQLLSQAGRDHPGSNL